MSTAFHPLLARLLRKVGASPAQAPSIATWQAMLALTSKMFHDADQDRYTLEHAMDVLSGEMHDLYRELERKTEQELAALRISDERHRLLFQENPLPIWVLDAKTLQYVAINNSMITTYGYSREELLAMTAVDVKQPADVPEMMRSLTSAVLGGVHHIGVRKHRRKDGTVLEMDITAHPITFEGRRCILGIAMDTTHARRLAEDLRQAQKMEAIGQLAGGVAHDFNNILAVILANAEFALEDLGPEDAGVAQLAEIRDAANRAAGLTRQLLTFSRKQNRQPRPLALNAVVTGIEAMLTRIVGEDIAMSATIAPDLGTIEADRGEIEQILMNLVVNARDAMEQGGRLALETTNASVDIPLATHLGVAPGRYVVLAVTDTGCGMSAAIRGRIFEPFFTTKALDRGTGLGLATVFGIVKQANGGIDVESEVDRGTTFRIYWPRIDAAVTTAPLPRFVAPRGAGTILIVEDDGQLRQILRQYLTSWGYTLLEAPNGAAALQLLRDHPGKIDLLLTDLVMPELDGRSLSRELLVLRPRTRVVFMSGYTEHAALANAALGPDDLFLQKPFTAQALAETLGRALADGSVRS
ncbi:MAG TPA: ATP-binding protein [Kofleriaceae bacterium]|nr:ATP-binding protein [Kofleriaceae bacterium]